MITLQHSLVTLLALDPREEDIEKLEKKFSTQIPFVLLPDGIRKYTGPRPYSHFEESSDKTEISFMSFPTDLKGFSKEKFEQDPEKFLSSKIIPAVIGEDTKVGRFEETNQYLPAEYYYGVKKHLVQDVIFDKFIRDEIDCSDKYNDNYYFNGIHLNGQELRKLIADIEMEGFEILAYMAYMQRGMTTNQEWFDRTVKTALEREYPQELAESTYNYMKIPEELNKKITEHDFEELKEKIKNGTTLIPIEHYKKMYLEAFYKMMDIDYAKSLEALSTDDTEAR